jgi:hypothetical protein
MKPPIFVYDPGDLDVFESVELAERYIEAIDVKKNLYVYLDADGRKLTASVYKDKRGVELCSITEPTEAVFDEELLMKLIIDMLGHISRVHPKIGYSEETLTKMSLGELVKESLRFKTR